MADPENGNPDPPAFNANEAVIALDALTAQLAVPFNEPVIDPLTLTDPENWNTSALIVKLSADEAVNATEDEIEFPAFIAYEAEVDPLAYDALNMLLNPNGPLTLEEVTQEAVSAIEDEVANIA